MLTQRNTYFRTLTMSKSFPNHERHGVPNAVEIRSFSEKHAVQSDHSDHGAHPLLHPNKIVDSRFLYQSMFLPKVAPKAPSRHKHHRRSMHSLQKFVIVFI